MIKHDLKQAAEETGEASSPPASAPQANAEWLKEEVFHQEQLIVWSEEIVSELAMIGHIRDPDHYDDVVDIHLRVQNFLKNTIANTIVQRLSEGRSAPTTSSASHAQTRNETIEECAKIADYWGAGNMIVQPEPGRSRYTLKDLQTYTNVAGRGIAEDIRALKDKE